MKLVSVIIPIYNVEQYVQRCLNSIVSQKGIICDIECIIVDDCSTDKSMDIVQNLLDVYHGPVEFVIMKHEKNKGLSASRNTGLSKASGDYIMFVDSDDYLPPNSLCCFIENMNKYPDVDMIIGNVRNRKGGNNLFQQIQAPCMLNDNNVFVTRMFRHQIYLYAWNKLIKRDLLINNQILFEDGIIYEDGCWSYELFSHISSILLLPQVTYVYEDNPSSITNTSFSLEKADLVLKSYSFSVNKMLDNPPLPIKYKKNMTVDYLLFLSCFLMSGVDLFSRFCVSKIAETEFRKVRIRLLLRSLCYGRLLLSCFFLLLFPPLNQLQKFRVFRHHYYEIESITNYLCHFSDFLHRKNKI